MTFDTPKPSRLIEYILRVAGTDDMLNLGRRSGNDIRSPLSAHPQVSAMRPISSSGDIPESLYDLMRVSP